MMLLAKITDKDINIDSKPVARYRLRKAARAVIFDGRKRVALMQVAKFHYHKLPGGGLKSQEDMKRGLSREVMEEAGAKITIIKPIGKINETRNRFKLKQTSYCYLARLEGKLTKQKLTDKEKNQGFKLRWVSVKKAIEIFRSDRLKNYEGKFVNRRDSIFLNEAAKNIKIWTNKKSSVLKRR